MRRKVFYIALSMLLIVSGCKSNKQGGNSEGSNFDIKVATNVVETYMKALSREDYESAKKMYTKDLAKSEKDDLKTDMKIKGYNLSETNEIGRSGMFKIKVTRTSLNNSASSLDEYTIKVVKDGADYRISQVDSTYEKEAFFENFGLRMRSKENVKTNLVIDLGSIPQYAYEKDDKANIYKLKVPRTNFGPINFSYNGERLAISTYDKDSFLGIVKIDESLATQGGAGGDEGAGGGQGGAGGQGGGAQGGQGGQGQQGGKEKPIGKETTPLDLIRSSKVQFMAFSLDEKYLVAQYEGAGKNRCLRIYKVDNGELIPFKFEDSFPIDSVDVVFSSFDKEVVNFEVLSRGNMDKNQEDVLGKYQLSLKDFKIKRI